MPQIRSIFHPDLPIDRRIEKVITFSNRQPEVLEAEAREYIVTKNLGSEYFKLLNYFDDAQKGDRGLAECCVWLSGFYGSGKSSFAKYFGLTFDPSAMIGDAHFADQFFKQFPDQAIRARFNTVRSGFEVSVFLVDLAAQGRADSAHTPISTQIYDQVCNWAGFATDAKIAQLEAKLSLDGKLEEFREKASESTGLPYEELRNLAALLIPTASRLAHEFYPSIWTNAESLQNMHTISTQTEQDRVKQMLELVQQKSGSKRVLFIVDEVGHFLRNNDSLISNLDGLARNLKEIGEGKAWLVATAQETLPNTGPLFGLRDRFPIKIDLKPSDIREITHKRLLKKSAEGSKILREHFGEKLVHLTRLESYTPEKELDEGSFVDFYPMLPQQFDILIDAIRSLARLQGGIGLRSAIRCVQDILIGIRPGEAATVDRPVPELVTAADLYDVLAPDITPVAKDSVLSVDRIAHSYGEGSWEHRVAKAIALLQQIDGFPITRKNLSALLYPALGSDSISDEIDSAVAALLADRLVPIGETDGWLGFLSETVSTIDKDRENIVVTSTSRLTIQGRLLREIFQKAPRTTISGAKTVEAGISLFEGGREQKVTDKDTDIRFLIQFVDDSRLAATQKDLTTESLATANASRIYIAVPRPDAVDDLLAEIHRAGEICKQHQNDSDPEVQRYLSGQIQLQEKLSQEVKQFLVNAIMKGWFIFRGNPSAAATLGTNLEAALQSQLTTAAEDVFHKFKLAPENVKSTVAEAFLKVKDLTQIGADRDPLSVVRIQGTDTNIDLAHPALAEIQDFLNRHSNPDGKRLLDEYARPPYGWNKETTRYLAAALFYAQRIKIRTNGQEVKVVGDLAFNAFRSSTSFHGVTILPNVNEIPNDIRQRAAKRLAELTGETVFPLPQKIAEIAVKYVPQFVKEFTDLPGRADGLGISMVRFQRLQNGLADALLGDGSDAPRIFGSENSELHSDILWARSIAKALDQGAEEALRGISDLVRDAEKAANQGLLEDLPEQLAKAGNETLATVETGDFVKDLPALTKTLEDLQTIVTRRCAEEVEIMKANFEAQVASIRKSSDYLGLDPAERSTTDENLARLIFTCTPDIEGILKAGATLLSLGNELQKIRSSIQGKINTPPPPEYGKKPEDNRSEDGKHPDTVGVALKAILKSEADLDSVLGKLEAHRPGIVAGTHLRLKLQD